MNLKVVLKRVVAGSWLGQSLNYVIKSVACVARVLSKLECCCFLHVPLCLLQQLFVNRLLQVVVRLGHDHISSCKNRRVLRRQLLIRKSAIVASDHLELPRRTDLLALGNSAADSLILAQMTQASKRRLVKRPFYVFLLDLSV